MDTESKVKEILKFGEELKGIKYNLWLKGYNTDGRHYPFYLDEIPKIEYIRKHGINCVGMINLMVQKIGLKPPGRGIHRGGTPAWYYHLKSKGKLEKFDDTKNYPVGTLFLRRYKSNHDRGHVAVYSKHNKKVLYGNVVHSYYIENPTDRKLGETTVGFCHFWEIAGNKGYFEFASLPDQWLNV